MGSPTEVGTSVWERKEGGTLNVKANEFTQYEYHSAFLENQSLVVNVQVNASISPERAGAVEIFLLNKTQYLQLKNDTTFLQENEELRAGTGNFSFKPILNSTYYVVLTNVDNQAVSVSVELCTFYTMRVFDYSLAFESLGAVLVGGVLFALSFCFENPIDRLMVNAMNKSIFPRVESYVITERDSIVTATWALFSIATVISAILAYIEFYSCNTSTLGEVPPSLIMLTQDLLIRYRLFTWFLVILIISLLPLMMGFGLNIVRHFLYWCFGIRYGRMYDRELKKRAEESFWREMVSPLSIVSYCAVAIMAWTVYSLTQDLVFPVIIIVVPLSLLLTHNQSVAFRKVYVEENERERVAFFEQVDLVSGLIMGGITLLIVFMSWDLFAGAIYSKTVGSSNLMLTIPAFEDFIPLLSEANSRLNSIRSMLIPVFEGSMVAGFSICFFSNFSQTTQSRKKKVKVLATEIEIFFATFLSAQAILLLAKQEFGLSTVISIAVAIATSVLSSFLRISWKTIFKPPRLCQYCERNLANFPEDILVCPYCGKPLAMKEERNS